MGHVCGTKKVKFTSGKRQILSVITEVGPLIVRKAVKEEHLRPEYKRKRKQTVPYTYVGIANTIQLPY